MMHSSSVNYSRLQAAHTSADTFYRRNPKTDEALLWQQQKYGVVSTHRASLIYSPQLPLHHISQLCHVFIGGQPASGSNSACTSETTQIPAQTQRAAHCLSTAHVRSGRAVWLAGGLHTLLLARSVQFNFWKTAPAPWSWAFMFSSECFMISVCD